VGRKPRQSNDDALQALRASLPASGSTTHGATPRDKRERRIITAELREQAADGGWHWMELGGSLCGILDAEDLGERTDFQECDTLRVQVDLGRSDFRIVQVVPSSHKSPTDKERRERIREIRRQSRPRAEKKLTHLDSTPPPGLRRTIRAVVVAIDGASITWQTEQGDESTTSSSPRAAELSAGQKINVVLQETDGAWQFVDFVAHTLQPRPAQPGKPKLGELALDAMYNLEAGDIVDAWLSFDGVPGADDAGREGKTRPAIFIAKRGTLVLLRGITDGESSYAQRLGTTAIRDWREAGLKKPSVVMAYDQEVDIADVWVRRGRLSEFDRRNLRIV
jgi:hypothetical protein